MLPKQYRLRRAADFRRVRRYGRSSGQPLLALYVLPNRTSDLRVGFTVSKRVGNAVARNRVKRLMREAVRHQLPNLRRGADLVMVARPTAVGASYRDIMAAVAESARRTGLLAMTRETVRNG